jgi:hypothetical protein
MRTPVAVVVMSCLTACAGLDTGAYAEHGEWSVHVAWKMEF